MDAITTIFVAAIKIIVDSGVLSKVSDGATTKIGENITDGVGNISQRLWAMLKRKAPNTDTVKKLGKGQEIDYQQAVIDVEAIADDPDVVKLLDEVRSLLSSNQELAAKVEELQIRLQQSGKQVNIGKQVNVDQSGNNNTQNNTFNL